jgi:aminocarboxymuconate-semialdehyde decarboxylase
MERAIKTLGLKAIGIVSSMNGNPIDLPEFEPFWAQAAELDIPVYIHPKNPSSTTGRSYEAEYDLIHNFGWPFETVLMLSRLVFSGIMERYPALKVVSHHLGGGMIPFYWGRTLETYEPENQRRNYGGQTQVLPKPLFDYFSRFYYDTAVGGSAPAIRCAYEVFGADQLIFATDAPWGPGTGEFRLAEYPKVIESLGLPEEDKRKIFADNARKMLNLD